MSREPVLLPDARDKLAVIGAALAAAVILIAMAVFVALGAAALFVMATLIRFAPFIVAVFAAIILAKCLGVV